MSSSTHISWTDRTVNPWWGCSKVSPACLNCYAEKLAWRFAKLAWGRGSSRRKASENVLAQPLAWNRAAKRKGIRYRVFCASMADVFDEEVPEEWRAELWDIIRQCTELDWQLLTKRPENIASMLPPDWGDGWSHVWLGVTVEDQTRADQRIPILQSIPASIRFLSAEPLLGPVTLDLNGIDWVILGGESGPHYRPMHPDWARSVRDQCLQRNVAFHLKQWGTTRPTAAGCLLDGREWKEFPKTPYTVLTSAAA